MAVRAAPVVAVRTGPTPMLAGLLVLLWLAGALAVAAAVHWGGLSLPATLALLLLVLASTCAIGSFWRQQRPHVLSWDGSQWLLTYPGQAPDARRDAVRIVLALDLQRAVLVCSWRRVLPLHRRWLWLQQDLDVSRWHALRCALYSDVAEVEH